MNPHLQKSGITKNLIFQREACSITCTEQQQDLHAQVLVIGHLQSDKLITDLQHLLALVGHKRQLHTLSERRERKDGKGESIEMRAKRRERCRTGGDGGGRNEVKWREERHTD